MISDAQLSGEIMTGNYELVYYVAENVEIIVILAYQNHLGTMNSEFASCAMKSL
jgi:hypothetical protein